MKNPAWSLGVIGAGVMGKALVRALLDKKVLDNRHIWAATRKEDSRKEAESQLGVTAVIDYSKKIPETDVLLVCVKPAQMKNVLGELRKSKIRKDTLVISIAAGVSCERLEEYVGGKCAVVRAMPNTPCTVGEGFTAIAAGSGATAEHMAIAKEIFTAVGLCLEMEEKHFDAVTGLSGSGPAYFFLIMEALADGGVRVGLPRDLALKMVAQTMLGSARVVQKLGRHPASLRDDVTTPAGCTIGALLIMEDGKIRSTLARAIEEATRIAGKLGDSK